MDKNEILIMLYRACRLYQEQCEGEVPDWVQIVANGNTELLEDVAEVARDDDTWEESWQV